MKRAVCIGIIITIPVLVFLNVFQTFRYYSVEKDISSLEHEQKEWIEKNKRVVSGIAVLNSPIRIEKIAKEEFKLKRVRAEQIDTIIIPPKKEELDEL